MVSQLGRGFGGPPPENIWFKWCKILYDFFMKVRDRVYGGLGEGAWNFEVIRIF